jgi:6-phosphogluconolactonase (cycloisomerase 2 family)
MSLLRRARLAVPAALALAVPLALTAHPAQASPAAPGAVYVLSNQVSGNSVLTYDRFADGRLAATGSVSTGGAGTGGGLGSQGAVILDDSGRHLYAVNAGSDSVSSFRVTPDGLDLVGTVASGGSRPTSLTVRGDLLYVLNAGDTGNIAGFNVDDGALTPLAGSSRALSTSASAPAQVQFSPKGDWLVVSERATNRLSLYAVGSDGLPTATSVIASAGTTPFGFAFTRQGTAIVSEAAGGAADASTVSSYDLRGGALQVVSPAVPTTETAACWIAVTGNGRFAYAGNAGSASITGYGVGTDGSLSILDADGKTGTAAAGVIDLDVSVNSRFLYGRLSNGTVGGWAVAADGSLTALVSAAGLPAGAAGIAAS